AAHAPRLRAIAGFPPPPAAGRGTTMAPARVAASAGPSVEPSSTTTTSRPTPGGCGARTRSTSGPMERSSLRAGMMTMGEVNSASALDEPDPGSAMDLVVKIGHRVHERLPTEMTFGVPTGSLPESHRTVAIVEQADDPIRQRFRPRVHEHGPIFRQEGAMGRN